MYHYATRKRHDSVALYSSSSIYPISIIGSNGTNVIDALFYKNKKNICKKHTLVFQR